MNLVPIEGKNMGARKTNKDRRMSGNDELRILECSQGFVKQNKKCELALWGEGGFGFV